MGDGKVPYAPILPRFVHFSAHFEGFWRCFEGLGGGSAALAPYCNTNPAGGGEAKQRTSRGEGKPQQEQVQTERREQQPHALLP